MQSQTAGIFHVNQILYTPKSHIDRLCDFESSTSYSITVVWRYLESLELSSGP